MTNIQIANLPVQATAAVREQVPMTGLTEFFSRAFQKTMAALQAQGVSPAGAPYGKYYGRPGATLDVEAGFPVATEVLASGDVAPGSLPGGRAVEALHIGPYDTMEATYSEIERYFSAENLIPGAVMWESYLTDPGSEPDPAKWQTLICWPIDVTGGGAEQSRSDSPRGN